LTGTLKSTRISTRLPARSRSSMKSLAMGIPFDGVAAARAAGRRGVPPPARRDRIRPPATAAYSAPSFLAMWRSRSTTRFE
jgi:hypothetical protein